jgi:hypothetical protein
MKRELIFNGIAAIVAFGLVIAAFIRVWMIVK